MRTEDLSGTDARVYQAVAELEDQRSAPHLHDVARRAGLDLDETHAALRRLTGDHGLVHEVADTGQPDLGPTYELAPRT